MDPEDHHLICPLCGQLHQLPVLRIGQRALCVRCGAMLAKCARSGPGATVAFALTGLILAIPCVLLPLVTLETVGHRRASVLLGGVEGLWHYDFHLLAALVLFAGMVAPLLLLGLVIILRMPRWTKARTWRALCERTAHAVQHWAMPEVQVLGVMVAFFKLGDLADVFIGPGLWFYTGASLATLLAWRSFSLETPSSAKDQSAVSPVALGSHE
jgi:paraquat-inducible protein A